MAKSLASYGIKIFFILIFALLMQNHLDVVYEAVFDSYVGIGIFVTLTLFIIYFFEHYTQNAMVRFLRKHQKIQVPVASLLGVLPGCGGAIMVVTNYSKGYVTYGAMVATLLATMGDAAILLMQRKPKMAIIVFVICTITAVIVGYLVDFLSKEKFAKPKESLSTIPAKKSMLPIWAGVIWFLIFSVNAVFYFFPNLAQDNIKQSFACTGILLTILLWVFKNPHHSCDDISCQTCTHGTINKVIIETSFIISWIFIGMLTYKTIFTYTHFDVAGFINANIYYVPLAAMIIGLIPGCGPQIIVTTFYVNGLIPFAGQVANAISNDGDALLPAIAMQPKKALLATVYTMIPAVIVGYGILFFYKG